MTPVAVYARYSTDMQDPRSIADQIRRCKDAAAAKALEVVCEFSDRAVSGGHMDRAGLRDLLAAATKNRRAPFRSVLVDDLSRLSRSIGDFWRIIDDLAAAGVNVIDARTGMSSDDPNARVVFAALSMVNDQQRLLAAFQTHRGLGGRAHAGFATGGSLYGYKTFPEPTPEDPEHPRKLWAIDPDEAKIVRRIFREYEDGACSLKSIADRLNRDAIAPPRNNGRGNKHGGGWTHSTVRAILINPKYIGSWAWNTTKYVRVPGLRARRQLTRPATEHIKREHPELAIISRKQWDAVQARFQRHHGSKTGRPSNSGKHHYLLAGLMKCGTCGGPMSVTGMRIKNGIRYAQFGCTANRSRGSSICDNAMSISDKKLTTTFLAALDELLTSPDIVNRFFDLVAKHASKRGKTKDTKAQLARQLADAEQRVRNVTGAMARRPDSAALERQLDEEEQTVRRLKGALAELPTMTPARGTPSKEAIRASLGGFAKELQAGGAEQGRERLARCMRPLKLTPKTSSPGRGFHVTGALALPEIAAVSDKKSSGGMPPDFSGKIEPTADFDFFVAVDRIAA